MAKKLNVYNCKGDIKVSPLMPIRVNLHPEKIFFQVDSLQKNQGFQDLNLFLIYGLNPAFFRLEILKNIRVCRTLISQIKVQINRLTRGIHEVN